MNLGVHLKEGNYCKSWASPFGIKPQGFCNNLSIAVINLFRAATLFTILPEAIALIVSLKNKKVTQEASTLITNSPSKEVLVDFQQNNNEQTESTISSETVSENQSVEENLNQNDDIQNPLTKYELDALNDEEPVLDQKDPEEPIQDFVKETTPEKTLELESIPIAKEPIVLEKPVLNKLNKVSPDVLKELASLHVGDQFNFNQKSFVIVKETVSEIARKTRLQADGFVIRNSGITINMDHKKIALKFAPKAV